MGIKEKRGQITLFIIIAIVILIIAVTLFYPRIKVIITPSTPISFVESCILEGTDELIESISLQGGSLDPSFYYKYQGVNIEYLCYTNEYYKTCAMQRPFLKQHIQGEIQSVMGGNVRSCLEGLREEMEKRGYDVNLNYKGVDIEIVPNNVIFNINADITLRREDSVESFDKLKIEKKSRMYDFIIMATNILNLEARFGDSETVINMIYYPNVKVEKYKQGEGTKVYILTDLETDEKFMFATRSLAWPGGYRTTL